MENQTFNSGANIDLRTEAEKEKDYHFEEIVASVNPVNWVEKPRDQWRKFPIFNQDGSGSCVAQTLAKLLGVLYWLKNQVYVHFSATHIYQQRSNKPAGGMAGVNAFEIAKNGVTLEELVPSQSMSDAQMDAVEIPQYKKDVGAVFKVPNYVQVSARDIETIASIIQTTGKAVMVWFYFQYDEWTEHPVVKNLSLDLYAASTCRHSLPAVDFTLVNGKKCLIIEDSWGPNAGVGGQRVIDEDFFKVRNWFAAYPVNFKFFDESNPAPTPVPTPTKPKHTFNIDLQFGMRSTEVTALQNVLKYEGTYPTNTDSTGYFGAITKSAVQKFQDKYGIASAKDPGYGRCGPKTRAKLNSIYS